MLAIENSLRGNRVNDFMAQTEPGLSLVERHLAITANLRDVSVKIVVQQLWIENHDTMFRANKVRES